VEALDPWPEELAAAVPELDETVVARVLPRAVRSAPAVAAARRGPAPAPGAAPPARRPWAAATAGDAAGPPERHVTVSIGRLEVRVTGEPAAAPARPARPQAMSLQEYLRSRGGGP
jgi:hypothetical protein